MAHAMTHEQWIARANQFHDGKYTYPDRYVRGKDRIRIICPEHGEFFQIAFNHTKPSSPHGCDKCGRSVQHASINKGIEYFLEKAREAHGDRFDYSLVEYVNDRTKVQIVCPDHGPWWQTPNSHKQGQGCRECGFEKIADDRSDTKEHFIAKAEKHFGPGRYDYSMTEYTGALRKVSIRCIPCDNVFEQYPTHHTRGMNGCDICGGGDRGFKPELPGTLYYLRFDIDGRSFYKIGITNRSVEERFNRDEYTVLSTVTFKNGKDAVDLERLYLDEFSEHRYKGPKVLKNGGDTELFTEDVLGLETEE